MTGSHWDDYSVDPVEVVHARCKRCPPGLREEVRHLTMTRQATINGAVVTEFEAWCVCGNLLKVTETREVPDTTTETDPSS